MQHFLIFLNIIYCIGKKINVKFKKLPPTDVKKLFEFL